LLVEPIHSALVKSTELGRNEIVAAVAWLTFIKRAKKAFISPQFPLKAAFQLLAVLAP
jgi:hypothetical protein